MNDVIKNIGHFSFRLPDELSGLDGKNRAVMLDDVVSILEEYQRKQPQADKWIPCEERLPSESGYYLICVQDLAVKDFGFIETWFDLENSEWQRVHVGETVVAWQLIPEFCKKDHLGEVNGIVKEGNSHENT